MTLAAELNKRVTLQRQSTDVNAANEPISEWVNLIADGDGKLWASVTDISGREFVASASTQNAVETTIVIRHRPGIEPPMRVLHGAEIYHVEAVLGQAGRTLQLMCSRGVTDG